MKSPKLQSRNDLDFWANEVEEDEVYIDKVDVYEDKIYKVEED